MGIATGTFQQILSEHRLRPFAGRLLTLGRQDIYLRPCDFEFWTQYYGVELLPSVTVEYAFKSDLAAQGMISDREFFGRLGVSCESMDASDYEGCDHVADLNSREPLERLRNQFDLVLDTGTFEHVFHIPNAFAACHSFLKNGGRMIHMSPLSNYADHGFYMLSPTLFYDFYETNGWRILQMKVIRHSRAHDTEPYWSTDYSPEHFNTLSFGGLDGALYQTFGVFEKLPGSTAHKIPQQRAYRVHAWAGSDTTNQGNAAASVSIAQIEKQIRSRLGLYANWISALVSQTTPRIAFYGAGAHTAVLLRVWRELGLPQPAYIAQTYPPADSEFCGIPLLSLGDLSVGLAPDVIVFSSHRHEAEMAAACRELFPEVPTLGFWV